MLLSKKRSISKKTSVFFNQKASGRKSSLAQIKRAKSDLADYQMRETLGIGGFGTVRKGIHILTGQTVAIKICDLPQGKDPDGFVEREAELQRAVLHSNIAHVYEVIRQDGKNYIIMEYCRNGELFDRINRQGRLEEAVAAKIFHQILSALCYLRSCGLSHRDIKPENILFDEQWNAKLVDFGFCCEGKDKLRRTVCGTPSYSPPEIHKKVTYDPELVDVWSLGVTLYTMLAAEMPFQGKNFEQRKKNILSFRYKQQPFFSAKVQKLFASIFVDAKYRPSLSDLMHSEFFLSYDFGTSSFIDYKNENPQVEHKVIEHIESCFHIERRLIEQSVKKCRLDRYRAIYYLTLRSMKELTPYRKRRSSLLKLEPISRTPSLTKNKKSMESKQFLNIKMGGFKSTELEALRRTPIIDNSKIKNRRDLPDSPRRLLDCLAAYKNL